MIHKEGAIAPVVTEACLAYEKKQQVEEEEEKTTGCHLRDIFETFSTFLSYLLQETSGSAAMSKLVPLSVVLVLLLSLNWSKGAVITGVSCIGG